MAYPQLSQFQSNLAPQAQPIPQTQNWLSKLWHGQQPSLITAPKVTGDQSNALNQFLQMALSGMQNPQSGFEPIAQQAREQFAQQTIPSIAERFSGLGSGGSQGSSAFGQQLGAAGAGLESSLASQGAEFGQKQQQLMQMLAQLGLMPQFENIFQQGSGGGLAEQLPQLGLKAGMALL